MNKDKGAESFLGSIRAVDEKIFGGKKPESKRSPAPIVSTDESSKEVSGGGESPPNKPTSHSGGGGGSGDGSSKRWSSQQKNSAMILIVMGLAILAHQIWWVLADQRKQTYDNTPAGLAQIENDKIRAQKKLVEAQAELAAASGPVKNGAIPQLYTAPQATPAFQVVNDLSDGATAVIPENAKIVLRGPMTMTILNSAGRIKGYSGDFKVHVENSENWAWTSGFAPESPPMTPKDFFWHLRKHPEWPSRVTIQVNQGVVELTTTNLKE